MKRITLAILIVLFPVFAFGADLHVGSGQAYATIAEAISAASGGDTIYIHAGTYDEYNLRPPSGSDNSHRTIVTGVDGEARPVISHTGQTIFNIENINYLTLQKLEVSGGTGNEDGAIILGQDYAATYITIDHCKVTGTTPLSNAAAIRLESGSNWTITNNEIIGNGYTGSTGALGVSGIKANGNAHSNVTIANNYFHEGFQGIAYKWGSNTDKSITIEKNYIKNSGRRAIYADQSYLVIRNNVINGCVRGMHFGDNFNGSNCTADHNTIYGATYAAIECGMGNNSTLSNSIIYSLATIYLNGNTLTQDHVFNTDPSFTNSASDDFTLAVGSGAIDYCADGSDAGATMTDIGIDGTQAGAGESETPSSTSSSCVGCSGSYTLH